jgi:hypothetical protein
VKSKYKVIMSVIIDGKIRRYGDVVELDQETAVNYAVALIAIEDKKGETEHGGRT